MQKKIPMRMCVSCRQSKPKRELIRIVCTKEGAVSADPSGKASGRGAYICRDKACLEKARKTKVLERTFSCKIEPEVYEKLAFAIDMPDTKPGGGKMHE